MIQIEGFDFDNILIDEKSYENVSVYNISYKTLICTKSMRIRLNKVHGFMRFYDRTIYLKLFELGNYHEVLHRIRYLVVVKSGIT